MRTTSLQKLGELQKTPENIRNICILAHVDHGKTTLADTLVASNGIISQRMAGKLRYMDSREDEQLRGITMKSSAISLHYNQDENEYLINLIDSPGHIDFSSEVSTAVRLCDGAVVLVDVVEGVCPQTHAVLRQAWLENIKPVLILNKVDRLITELKMSPVEAYLHLQHILEQVNAITGELFTSQVLEKSSANKVSESEPHREDQVYDWSTGMEDADDSSLYFSPDQGNVIFASAIDGWGFGIQHFSELFAAKLGFKAAVLNKTLWGDFYLENKTKRIKRGAQARGKKPLFVQFILDNLWAVYEAVLDRRDGEMIEKIVKSMKLKIQARDTRHSDPRIHLQAITSQWLPLSKAVLAMVVHCLPSPLGISEERVEKLVCSNAQRFDSLPPETQRLKTDFLACSPGREAPVIVYVSKMLSVDWKSLPQNKQRPLTHEEMTKKRDVARQRHAERTAAMSDNKENTNTEQVCAVTKAPAHSPITLPPPSIKPHHEPTDQVFIAFARVFSGTVRPGTKLYVLGPKHDPAQVLEELEDHDNDESILADQPYIQAYTVQDLYLFMGKELEAMDQVPAGNLLGLGGLQDYVLKSATLSSTVACPAFTDMYMEAAPIVRVALEPVHPGDMKRLTAGLRLLNQADPCVRVFLQGTGEHVIMAAGEVHLQKCLDDLKEKYAKVEVIVSKPIVPFRETIIPPPTTDMVNEVIDGQVTSTRPPPGGEDEEGDATQPGVVELQTANRLCTIRIHAVSLPEDITQLLEDNTTLLQTLELYSAARTEHSDLKIGYRINKTTLKALREFRTGLQDMFVKSGDSWAGVMECIWSFGPKRNGPNLLVNQVAGYKRPSIWSCLDNDHKGAGQQLWDFDNSIVSGFQMATLSGPLCEEPMRGVCYFVEKWDTDKTLCLRERKMSDRERKASERERRLSGKIRTISGMFGDNLEEDSLESWQGNRTPTEESEIPLNENSCESQHTYSNGNDSQSTTCATGSDNDVRTYENCPDREARTQETCPNSEARTPEMCPDSEARTPISGVDTACVKTVRLSVQDDVPDNLRRHGPFTGQLMSSTKEACRRAFQSQPQRLMVAMYSCVIQATADVLGKLYGVLGKRAGRVLQDDMIEGSSLFSIGAVLPVVESFGFAEEIRKKTSGLASPQLKFSHWEVIDIDPFWVPTTEEEYLHYGEKADSANQARCYMDKVRRRKGLKVDDKLVEFAEKQRTLSKNK